MVAGDLVGLFLIGGAGAGANLGQTFPAGVDPFRPWILAFDLFRQLEEAVRFGEGGVHLGRADTGVAELEKAHLGVGTPELVGDLGAAVVEVAEVDDTDLAAIVILAGSTEGSFAVQLVEAVGGGAVVANVLRHLCSPLYNQSASSI